MTNWRGFLAICAIVLATNANAQANLLNATIPEEVGVKTVEQMAADNDKPLPYGYIDDRDILWSKVVWEYIDLNEKINQVKERAKVSLSKKTLISITFPLSKERNGLQTSIS